MKNIKKIFCIIIWLNIKFNLSYQSTADEGCRIDDISNIIVSSKADNPRVILPGEYVANHQEITYSCQRELLLKGVSTNYCSNSKWSEPHPTCIKYCNNNNLRSITIEATCETNGSKGPCKNEILPGTRATIICQFGYQKLMVAKTQSDILYCGNNGEWDYLPIQCEQVCGEDPPALNPFILGGRKTNITKVPWHVGIYSSLEGTIQQICGGTIINARIVISAAHCFWNGSYAKINDNSYYKVGAGKYYRNYNATEDLPVQFSDVEEIHVNEGYQDANRFYELDIAVLILKNYLQFTSYIKPACIKWNDFKDISIQSNLIGRVAGWGKTTTAILSAELNTIELSTLSYADCLARTEREYQILITSDKFCVGSNNGRTVCKGDSGGGFLIPSIDANGIKQFYLQGIVSNGINSNDECTGDFLTAYTNIQHHKHMVESDIRQFKEELQHVSNKFTKGCRIVQIPNLIVKLGADKEMFSGNYISEFQGITYSCQQGYFLIGPEGNYCSDSQWSEPTPKCKKYCDNNVFQNIRKAVCEFNGTSVSCKNAILPGTRAKIICQSGYQEPIYGLRNSLFCGSDGQWDYSPCEQICGEEAINVIPLIVGGSKTNNTKVPWRVGIYSSLMKVNEVICGGTIVSAKIVVSAAHCFWNQTNHKINDNSYYKIGAGKYYRNYYAKEPLPVQFSDVQEIHIIDGYNGSEAHFLNNIAVLVLKTSLKFNFYIKPACLIWNSDLPMKSNLTGRVAGWGITATGLPSNELKTVELSTLSYDDCLSRTEKEYHNFINTDNFCAGNSFDQGVCRGDSGEGFLVPIKLNGVKRFVLQGIVSNGINAKLYCRGDSVTTYTNIQHHKQIVESYIKKFNEEPQIYEIQPTSNQSKSDDDCRISYVSNLIVKLEGDNPEEILPGKYVPNFQGISYSCERRHLLKGSRTNYCIDGEWSEQLPKCTKYCDNNVFRSVSIDTVCELKRARVSCEMPILPGTQATIACKFGYLKPNFISHENLFCLDDGEWDYEPYRCEQVCGENALALNPFILGGSKTNNTQVPWHVGIYSSPERTIQQICGGTIVSAKIVVSAAHCFWNNLRGQINANSYYKVGAGKYYRNYNAKELLPVQFTDVDEIHIPAGYNGIEANYINNIAVLVLKTYLTFNFHIKPACLIWNQYNDIVMKSNIVGNVAGWGITAAGVPSNELISIEISTLSYDDCSSKTAKEYQSLITYDKFCADSHDGPTVCAGDSGGGFLTLTDVNGVKRFALQGIVSTGINSNIECKGDFITTYTNIQYYRKMLESYINKFNS